MIMSLSCLILEEAWWHRFDVMLYPSTPGDSPESNKQPEKGTDAEGK
jgi:hypothetical protein